MSSKIYGRVEARPAEPLVWPCVNGSAVIGDAIHDPGDPKTRQAQLERDLERRLHEARQAGFQEGVNSAKTAVAAEMKSLSERIATHIAELAYPRPRLRRQAEGDLLKLALAIAHRILHRELSVDPGAMQGVIQAALDKLQSQE